MADIHANISIIIPAYNSEKYIDACVKSIIIDAETAKCLYVEVIIVINGCKDRTEYVVKKLCNNQYTYCKISYFQSSKGVSCARNLGIEKSTGKYIFFVDADDVWVKGSIPIITKDICEDADLIIYSYNKNSDVIRHVGETVSASCTNDVYRLKKWMLMKPTLRMPVWAKGFKFEIIKKYNISFNEKLSYAEDGDFIIRYLLHTNRIKISKDAIYQYNINSDSATNRINKDRINGYIDSMNCSFENIKSYDSRMIEFFYVYVLVHIVVICVHDIYNANLKINYQARNRKLREVLGRPVFSKALKDVKYKYLLAVSLLPIVFFKIDSISIGGAICYIKSLINNYRMRA
ncbi:glycosyltransferase family 2 protein [Selenomonas ruminantium]|uniref:glycosyltransferase family 2 protein n=1 Tax=Selenomonas ruminantium TaxID=971 RepID=UPI0004141C1F|nr:glycosyltransferase [Selenomonas ruminantium]